MQFHDGKDKIVEVLNYLDRSYDDELKSKDKMAKKFHLFVYIDRYKSIYFPTNE